MTFNLPFKVILRRFWGCFLMSGMRMLHFWNDLWKFIQIHQYYGFKIWYLTLSLCLEKRNVSSSVNYEQILVGFTGIAVNFKFHSWFPNLKLQNHNEILRLARQTTSRGASHSKLADVWMHKPRGFANSKLGVTSPITVRLWVNTRWCSRSD